MSATTIVRSVQFTTRNAEMIFPGDQWKQALEIYLQESASGNPIGLENSRSFFRLQTDHGDVELYVRPGDPHLHAALSPLARARE